MLMTVVMLILYILVFFFYIVYINNVVSLVRFFMEGVVWKDKVGNVLIVM